MLPVPSPPADIRPASPPTWPPHAWRTLQEARTAAKKSSRRLIVFIPDQLERREAALAFLQTLEGVHARGEAEICLLRPEDPEGAVLLDRWKLRSRPALLQLDAEERRLFSVRLGEDCVPFPKALLGMVEGEAAPIDPALVQAWIGPKVPLQPFLDFAKARHDDLSAGAREPFRSWLVALIKGSDPRLRSWAAARLVEAGAPLQNDDPNPVPLVLSFMENEFRSQVLEGNLNDPTPGGTPRDWGTSEEPPHPSLGPGGHLDAKAPCWAAWRSQLLNTSAPTIRLGFYALFAPRLADGDQAWLLRQWTIIQSGKHPEPWSSASFWLATDWLMAFGTPADWSAFLAQASDPAWKDALGDLKRQLEGIKAYWGAPPKLQNLFCGERTAEAFWKDPDSCLAAWGVTRESLLELGMDQVSVKVRPRPPSYPFQAKRRHLSATLVLRILIDKDGTVQWVRPEPGYALGMLGATGLAYAARWRFDPTRIAGKPMPSIFVLTMPFKLR